MRVYFSHILLLTCAAMLFGMGTASAQLLPERKLVRQGNEQFERRNFNNSLNRYNEALEHAPHSYEAQYNRANTILVEHYEVQCLNVHTGVNNASGFGSRHVGSAECNCSLATYRTQRQLGRLITMRIIWQINPLTRYAQRKQYQYICK